jgi:hypothetical protein
MNEALKKMMLEEMERVYDGDLVKALTHVQESISDLTRQIEEKKDELLAKEIKSRRTKQEK